MDFTTSTKITLTIHHSRKEGRQAFEWSRLHLFSYSLKGVLL